MDKNISQENTGMAAESKTSGEKKRDYGNIPVILTGLVIYALGFLFFRLVGRNTDGFFAFMGPFSIIAGTIVIAIGAIF